MKLKFIIQDIKALYKEFLLEKKNFDVNKIEKFSVINLNVTSFPKNNKLILLRKIMILYHSC